MARRLTISRCLPDRVSPPRREVQLLELLLHLDEGEATSRRALALTDTINEENADTAALTFWFYNFGIPKFVVQCIAVCFRCFFVYLGLISVDFFKCISGCFGMKPALRALGPGRLPTSRSWTALAARSRASCSTCSRRRHARSGAAALRTREVRENTRAPTEPPH